MAELTREEGVERLLPLLRAQKLMIVVGSGVSVSPPTNLPDWDGLLKSFVVYCGRQIVPLLPLADDFRDVIAEASIDEQRLKQPIRIASVLKQKLMDPEINRTYAVEPKFREWISKTFASAVPNANHDSIVETNYKFILTTNYDVCLSDAASKQGLPRLSNRAFGYQDAGQIAASIYEDNPCIVHLHGRYFDSNETSLSRIVFTAQDYLAIKKKNPGFTVAIQSLLLRYSTLFVGYGASDPHLEDLLEEMSDLFRGAPSTVARAFIVMRRDKAGKIFVKYKDHYNTDVIVLSDYSETPLFLNSLRDGARRNDDV